MSQNAIDRETQEKLDAFIKQEEGTQMTIVAHSLYF